MASAHPPLTTRAETLRLLALAWPVMLTSLNWTLLQVTDVMVVGLVSTEEVAATVRWVNGYRGGVEFDAPQDIAHVFRLRDDQGHIARTPRFAMQASASMRIGDLRVPVDILDISPGGVKLRSDRPIPAGQAGSVLLPEIDVAAFGSVCWTRDDRLGFRFCTPLSLAVLSRVLGCG